MQPPLFVSTIKPELVQLLERHNINADSFDRWGVDTLEDVFDLREIDLKELGITREQHVNLMVAQSQDLTDANVHKIS